ncbi:MAG: hypothetical protein LIO41_02645 [Ruminococcus sp.]|nr:hypothetical protein [Ruminococcus sp.]MCD8327731.1 hypothetical protein [Ruminococcus sp.]
MKKLFTIAAMVAIIASISTMGASAAVIDNGDTASPNAITDYGPMLDVWSSRVFTATGANGQSKTNVTNHNSATTKVVVEVSRWSKTYQTLYDEKYEQDNVIKSESVETSLTQKSVGVYRYLHSADIYGSTTSNTVVHTFSYETLF